MAQIATTIVASVQTKIGVCSRGKISFRRRFEFLETQSIIQVIPAKTAKTKTNNTIPTISFLPKLPYWVTWVSHDARVIAIP